MQSLRLTAKIIKEGLVLPSPPLGRMASHVGKRPSLQGGHRGVGLAVTTSPSEQQTYLIENSHRAFLLLSFKAPGKYLHLKAAN